MKYEGHVAIMGEKCAYDILVGKCQKKNPFGTSRCRCLDNIEIDLREVWYM
jgi:hypothetical protein